MVGSFHHDGTCSNTADCRNINTENKGPRKNQLDASVYIMQSRMQK